MTRILHLIETLGHGGAEHQLCDTVLALDRGRFSSRVAHLHPDAALAPRLRAGGVPVEGLGVPHGKAYWPLALAKLDRLVRRERIELIHTSLFEADLLGGLVGRRLGIPVVGTLCSIGGDPEHLIDNPHMSAWKLRGRTELWGWVLRHLHRHSVAISEAVKESAVRTYGLRADDISVIYRAFTKQNDDRSVDTAALRTSLGLAPSDVVLLNVGRLTPQKGQRYLVEAMPAVLREVPNARLLIVGRGWLEPDLKAQIAALGLEHAVSLLGRREDVPALMRMSDLFVFPSIFEGLGVSLVEAVGFGKACVATAVGPLPEVVEHERSGLLVPPRDPAALAQAVVRLCRNHAEAVRFGQNALEFAERRFSLPTIVRKFEGVYERILPVSSAAVASTARPVL